MQLFLMNVPGTRRFVYMSTVGNPDMDYMVADRTSLPLTHHMGTTKALYLPGCFFPTSHASLFPRHLPLFGVDPTLDRNRSELGLAARGAIDNSGNSWDDDGGSKNRSSVSGGGGFVFACFNKHLKIRSELFAVWADALHQVPNAKLWLLRFPKESETRLRATALKLGYA